MNPAHTVALKQALISHYRANSNVRSSQAPISTYLITVHFDQFEAFNLDFLLFSMAACCYQQRPLQYDPNLCALNDILLPKTPRMLNKPVINPIQTLKPLQVHYLFF